MFSLRIVNKTRRYVIIARLHRAYNNFAMAETSDTEHALNSFQINYISSLLHLDVLR